MFALRNRGDDASVAALARGLSAGSALFRHEIAYVLGQIQSAVAVPQLVERLQLADENEMVRHECAEVLHAWSSFFLVHQHRRTESQFIPISLSLNRVVSASPWQ